MNKIIYFILGTFTLVYLFESLDKTCKKTTIFDEIKTPLLTSSIIGIIALNIYGEEPYCLQFIMPFDKVIPSADSQIIFTDLGNF